MKDFAVEDLWYKIECLRQEMHITALEKGISHPDVLMISQRLDELINEFSKLLLI
ncbi:MAG: Sporulation stage 0, Spo0E-like regulatory phosphatase [Firmicutes bacterium]|nr:Sporulation stage 0, Spo0E-like regulatory phosphatase [Bacillota bacterium]